MYWSHITNIVCMNRCPVIASVSSTLMGLAVTNASHSSSISHNKTISDAKVGLSSFTATIILCQDVSVHVLYKLVSCDVN